MVSESRLLERAKKGDNNAFDQLANQTRARVYRSLLQACGNPDTAQDVLQDALINAFRALPNFRGDSQFATWLYTIARRLCIRARKDLDRFFSTDDPFITEEGEQMLKQFIDQHAQDPDALLIEEELKERVQSAIQALPESLRAVIVMRDMEDLSTEETARALNLTIPAVKARLHRAREQVRLSVEAYLKETL
ncbi:MAG: sigma-70 family RNA polymerase sigma factor [Fimbriimonadia bacterium]|nr:sigma-70 family RNA polymerase sigma factor [Fimbriimonadia bacterium]